MKQLRRRRRRGAAAVEFALVAPLFVMFAFGIIEFGRAMMVQQIMTNATREGAREAALPEATADSVKSSVLDSLAGSSVDVSVDNITVSPDPATAFNNEQITVSLTVPYEDVTWIPISYISGSLRASTRMRSERLE